MDFWTVIHLLTTGLLLFATRQTLALADENATSPGVVLWSTDLSREDCCSFPAVLARQRVNNFGFKLSLANRDRSQRSVAGVSYFRTISKSVWQPIGSVKCYSVGSGQYERRADMWSKYTSQMQRRFCGDLVPNRKLPCSMYGSPEHQFWNRSDSL